MDSDANGNGTDLRDLEMKLEMFSLETRAETPANNGGIGGGIAQGGRPGNSIVDERDLVWPMLQLLKDAYLEDMHVLSNFLTEKTTLVRSPDLLSRVHHSIDYVGRMISYLTVPKERLPMEFNVQKVEAVSQRIAAVMTAFKRMLKQDNLRKMVNKDTRSTY